jgi:ketosteroid isomerase-like protein
MRKLAIAAAAAVLVVTIVVRSQGMTNPVLNKMAAEWAAAYNAKDAAKLAGFYTKDAVFMAPNEPMAKGRAAIEAYFKRSFSKASRTFS